MMVPGSTAAFLDALRDSPLLTPSQRQELNQGLAERFADPRALAKELLRRSWLTPYQVNQVLKGRGADLLLGPYVVLERLGEGGTGQVFKTRHQKMDRIVALKLIRPELLTEPDVVRRFYREVQVLSQLSHPNVVHAYDAGPVGVTHFLAMEYVEGIDLSRLVKERGPLSVELACTYIRHAALGLQHVHERNLIHRDIKPSNLLLTCAQGQPNTGVVKILDLGLARLHSRVNGEMTNAMTPVGKLTMGTPDYLAPEQAIDFHEVDIRADLYSLGCTFYFLLTGRPPFPGGSMAQKLVNHQQSLPPPIERFRPDLPATLGVLVHRLLAKKPEDRYQTPAEVAVALGAALGPRHSLPATDDRTLPLPLPDTHPIFAGAEKRPRRKRLLITGAAGLALFLLGVIGLFVGRKTSTAEHAATTPAPATTPGEPGAMGLPVAQLRELIRPSPEEERWGALPWAMTLWSARTRAAQQGKPIFLWETDGHPLGCTATDGIGMRATVFSDPAVLRLIGDEFVPAPLDDWHQRRRKDAEGDFFRQVCELRTPPPGAGRQGLYCLTANGKLLAYRNSIFEPDAMRSFLQQGLAEWRKLPESQRNAGALTIDPPATLDRQHQPTPPRGGAVIKVYTRILEHDGKGGWRRGTSAVRGGGLAARDHVWLTAAETPGQAVLGAQAGGRFPLPERLADRLARYHLVDNTRGEPAFWQREEIRSSRIILTVRETTADRLHLTLEGHVLLATQADPARAERSFDVRLTGELTYDPRQKTWTRFDVLAVGDHRGESTYNPGARPGRTPLGIVFELARTDAPADQAPPGGMHDPTGYLLR